MPRNGRTEFPQAKLITNSENVGYSKGVNLGIREARGSFFLILNPDTVVGEDAIQQLLTFMETRKDAGIVGPKLVFYDGNTSRWMRWMLSRTIWMGSLSTGKVLSLSTTMEVLKQVNGGELPDNFTLALLYKRLPDEIKQALITPYLSEDGNQLRFSVRVYESDVNLKRQDLLQRFRLHLTRELGLSDDQVHLSGILVLYNNMLQSLFRSQILSLGFVFLAIFLMFILLFRSVKLALIALVPNLVAVPLVLGLMGGLDIPLDFMTITIAAIAIGIGVDDTIHYVHRFGEEVKVDWDYQAAVSRSHASIGRAMYYTTVTITIGFSILVLSKFVPTIYFGILTAFAMLIALVANFTVLPVLLVRLRPYGKKASIE